LKNSYTGDEIEYQVKLNGDGVNVLRGQFRMPEAYDVASIKILNGGYSQAVFDVFKATQMAVKEYHAAVEAVKSAMLLADSAISLIPKARAQYYYAEARRVFTFLQQREILEHIGMPQDPMNFKQQFQKLGIDLYRYTLGATRWSVSLTEYIHTPSSQILTRLTDGWIRHSSFAKPSNNGLFSALASLENSNLWFFARDIFSSDSIADTVLVKEAAASFTKQADAYANSGRMAEARIHSANALLLVSQLNQPELYASCQRDLSNYTHGILESFLSVSQKAASIGNLRMSGMYLQRALDFRHAHSDLLISDVLLKSSAEVYAGACLEQGLVFLGTSDWVRAIYYFENASQYLEIIGEWSQKDRLEMNLRAARQRHYEFLLMESVTYLRAENTGKGQRIFETILSYRQQYKLQRRNEEDEAMARIFKARLLDRLENIPGFISDSVFLQSKIVLLQTIDSIQFARLQEDSLVNQKIVLHSRRLIDNCFANASSMFWDDKPEMMKKWLEYGNALAEKTALSGDSTVRFQYNVLLEKIPELQCRMLRQDVFVMSIRAREAFDQRLWKKGAEIAREAILISKEHDNCQPDTFEIHDRLLLHHHEIAYNELLSSADLLHIKHLTDSLWLSMKTIKAYHQLHREDLAGEDFPDDIALLYRYPDLNIAERMIDRFIDSSEWRMALRYLDTLRVRGVREDAARALISKLGSAWGAAYSPENRDAWYAENLPAYDWYAFFRKSFEKENWKRKGRALLNLIPLRH
jgi:hypothetical protein